MRHSFSASCSIAVVTDRLRHALVASAPLVMGALMVGAVNLSLFARFELRQDTTLSVVGGISHSIESFFLANLGLLALLWIVRQRILEPWQRMCTIMRHATITMVEERGSISSALSLQAMATELARFTEYMHDAAHKHRHLQQELDMSRALLTQMDRQQQAIMANTSREVTEQYQHVLAYAHYLDEHIQQHQRDAQMRYDYDDVCESSFNLKLMMQSLQLVRRPVPAITTIPVSRLLQQTLMSMAPALDRRSMKLSTLGIDEELLVESDPQVLAHAWWMILLGTIRYAAEESTLRLRCLRSSDGTQAIISLLISELAPGQMTPDERQAHMVRQLQHVTPHMFSETIRLHGNVQLAEMLLSRVDGRISMLPISSYACEILMVLPISKK